MPHQLPPEGDWRTWVVMGGRGAGKTRAGAEWVRTLAEQGYAMAQLNLGLMYDYGEGVVLDDARGGEPPLAPARAGEQEAVVGHGAVHQEVGVPPGGVAVAGRPGLVEDRLGVVRRAQPDLLHVARAGPHPDADRAVQRRGLGVEVERGAVVVGLVEEAHGDMLPDPAPPGTGGRGCRHTRTCSRFRA